MQTQVRESLPEDVGLSLDIVSEQYGELVEFDKLKRTFQRDGYAYLPQLLQASAFRRLSTELHVIEKEGQDRSFTMPGYETPRVLRTVGGQTILACSPSVAALYFHRDLVGVVENIVGARVFPCQHTEEFVVANFLTDTGSTHGWHLDDPPLALIVFFEAPESADQGGRLEYVPGWNEFCAERSANPTEQVDATVALARAGGLVRTASHRPGDAYLLRADRCLHRVTPLMTAGCRRVVINMAYQLTRNQEYGQTATWLYGAKTN
jgi:hypothetical protein